MRAERLADDLGVSKGSFYWHFKDVPTLKEALIAEWEDEADLLVAALANPSGKGVDDLIQRLGERVTASEAGAVPSDAAIFAWAAVDQEVAARVARAEQERLALLSRLAGDPERGELAYMAYLGFILRRRRTADADRSFAILAAFLARTLGGTDAKSREASVADVP